MNIKQLESLTEVANSGSFLIAAQKIGVSEEVVRQSITSLENEIGFKLLECYNKSNAIPTFEGIQIIAQVKELLFKFQELEEKVRSMKNNSYCDFNNMYDVCVL